ncbi:MAG: hypothetical protein M3N53_04470 [Actinomycetota bacterium]|nr:hypothetical protein [Actinomycetota bacterium]
MYRGSRSAIIAFLILFVIALQIGTSWADPGSGKGRDDPPAHGREDAEEDAPEEEEAPEEEGSSEQDETSDDEASSEDGDAQPRQRARPKDDHQQSQEAAEEGSGDPPSDEDASGGEPSSRPADVVDLSFSASPATLSRGETSTLEVVASNPGSDSVGDIGLLVELPTHLDLVDSDPTGSSDGRLLSLDLGPLAPGASSAASITVAAASSPSGEQEPVRFAVSFDDRVIRHQLLVQVRPSDPTGLGLSQSSPLLVQVGENSSFSITVANRAETALEDVAVVTEVAPELDVVGVTAIAAADAIQVGRSPTREDIVWIFESLAPGEEVQLSWTGRAVAPGDLEALNVVDATVEGRSAATSTQNTYLGYVLGVRTDAGGEVAPVVEHRTVTKMVPVTVEVAGSLGGVLPVTGASPGRLVAVAVGLMTIGALLLVVSRTSRSRRRGLVVVLATVMLTGAACVSDGGRPSAIAPDAPAPSPTASATPDPAPKDKDQVLGLRLNRGPEGSGQGSATDTADEAGAAEPATTTKVVFEEVTSVVPVVVSAEELPAETMQSRSGDNTVSLEWTGDAVATQTSGRRLTAEMADELLASLRSNGEQLTATVALSNLARDRRLVVRGRLVLDIVSGEGRSSRLTSGPIDVVLEPGEHTAADLSFSLPAGTYGLTGGFVTD